MSIAFGTPAKSALGAFVRSTLGVKKSGQVDHPRMFENFCQDYDLKPVSLYDTTGETVQNLWIKSLTFSDEGSNITAVGATAVASSVSIQTQEVSFGQLTYAQRVEFMDELYERRASEPTVAAAYMRQIFRTWGQFDTPYQIIAIKNCAPGYLPTWILARATPPQDPGLPFMIRKRTGGSDFEYLSTVSPFVATEEELIDPANPYGTRELVAGYIEKALLMNYLFSDLKEAKPTATAIISGSIATTTLLDETISLPVVTSGGSRTINAGAGTSFRTLATTIGLTQSVAEVPVVLLNESWSGSLEENAGAYGGAGFLGGDGWGNYSSRGFDLQNLGANYFKVMQAGENIGITSFFSNIESFTGVGIAKTVFPGMTPDEIEITGLLNDQSTPITSSTSPIKTATVSLAVDGTGDDKTFVGIPYVVQTHDTSSRANNFLNPGLPTTYGPASGVFHNVLDQSFGLLATIAEDDSSTSRGAVTLSIGTSEFTWWTASRAPSNKPVGGSGTDEVIPNPSGPGNIVGSNLTTTNTHSPSSFAFPEPGSFSVTYSDRFGDQFYAIGTTKEDYATEYSVSGPHGFSISGSVNSIYYVLEASPTVNVPVNIYATDCETAIGNSFFYTKRKATQGTATTSTITDELIVNGSVIAGVTVEGKEPWDLWANSNLDDSLQPWKEYPHWVTQVPLTSNFTTNAITNRKDTELDPGGATNSPWRAIDEVRKVRYDILGTTSDMEYFEHYRGGTFGGEISGYFDSIYWPRADGDDHLCVVSYDTTTEQVTYELNATYAAIYEVTSITRTIPTKGGEKRTFISTLRREALDQQSVLAEVFAVWRSLRNVKYNDFASEELIDLAIGLNVTYIDEQVLT